MRGLVALRAGVVGGGDEAASEEFLPHAVDGDPRGERVVGRDQPTRQRQPVVGGFTGERR